MNIKEFAEAIKEIISEKKGLKADITEIYKNNDTLLTTLQVYENDDKIKRNFYIDSYYNSGDTPDEAAEDILSALDKGPDVNQDAANCIINNFEKVKDRITYRIINKERNEGYLKNIPYTEMFDLAKVYVMDVPEFSSDEDCSAVVTISNSLMETYGVTVEDLERLAKKNIRKTKPIIPDLMSMIYDGCFEDLYDGIKEGNSISVSRFKVAEMWVVTNESKSYGAALLANDKLLEMMGKIKGDFYILPSSVHEIICASDDGDDRSEGLKALVKNVNETVLRGEDFLSDSVYRYDSKKKVLSVLE